MKRVTLVGLGLIGGSIGQALRKAVPRTELIGVDRGVLLETEPVRALLTQSLAAEAIDESHLRQLDVDLVILATPVQTIIDNVCAWLDVGVPLTDCGSTKQAIVSTAAPSPRFDNFVPGHPMAGRERGGYESASPELFRGRPWLVCPEGSNSHAKRVVRELVDIVGSRWTEMSALEHDVAVAMTSHVPQLLASWLAASASFEQQRAAGPAFADMTRVAGGAESIWRDIFCTNSEHVAQTLRELSSDLLAVAEDLGAPQPKLDRLLALLARARRSK